MDKERVVRRERGPMSNFERPKDFKRSIIKLFSYAKKYMILIIIAVLFASFSSILSIIAPNKLSSLTDTITEGITPNINETTIKDIWASESISIDDKFTFSNILTKVKDGNYQNVMSYLDEIPESIQKIIEPKMNLVNVRNIAIMLGIIYLTSALLNFIQSFMMVRISNNFARNLRNKISVKINKLPLKYFDKNSLGDILSRVTNDVDTINMSMHQSLCSLVSALTLLIGSLVMMFYTNGILALTALISSLMGFVFMAFILKISQRYFKQRQVELGKINGHIEEVYTNHNVVSVYNGQKTSESIFDKLNKNVFTCNLKSQFLSGLMNPVMGFVGDLSYVAVCVMGAYLTLKGQITFGVIVAFMVYIRLFTSPLRQVAQGLTQLQSATAASERVFEFIEEEEMTDESTLAASLNKDKVKGKIEFDNVVFGYNENKIIIKNFSAKASPGQKIAIVGPTGAGKTTLVNLLMKFYEINDGDIKIDGVSIKNLTRENIHDLFIMVLQDTWLFNGTIRDNIKYNNEQVTDEEILEACKIVGLDHFISSLPNGLDSSLSDSENISAGQKQLLTIARGMIKNSPFLILDEATSNVDTRTEELVQKAMDNLTKGRTSFIIAHRLSTIKNADLILVMNEGNIIEQGTHEELMKQKGFYADLYNSQFNKNSILVDE